MLGTLDNHTGRRVWAETAARSQPTEGPCGWAWRLPCPRALRPSGCSLLGWGAQAIRLLRVPQTSQLYQALPKPRLLGAAAAPLSWKPVPPSPAECMELALSSEDAGLPETQKAPPAAHGPFKGQRRPRVGTEETADGRPCSPGGGAHLGAAAAGA